MKKLIFIFIIVHCILNIENCICQWGPDVRLTNASGYSYLSLNNAWCIAANGNVVHTVWYDERDGNPEIYCKRSTDGGINWGADIRLTNNNAYSYSPSVAVSGSLVHVIWDDERDLDYEIYYKRSTDDGINWGTDTRLTNYSGSSELASLAVSGSLIHVVWIDNRNSLGSDIFYKHSTNDGMNWGADIRLTINSSCNVPSIAVYGTHLHVVWEDWRDGNYEIYYKRSADGGINWGTDTRLTNNTAESYGPSVAVSGSLVHVVWYDYRDGYPNREIYYKRSTDGGINWEADTRLTNNTAYSTAPSIAVLGSNVHITWMDNRDGNWEIYYKSSTDGGINWGTDTRLTNNTGFSSNPFITVSGSIVHIVWQDNRNGNWEIYYKRNPTGNPTGISQLSGEIPSAFSLKQNYPNPFNSMTNVKWQMLNEGYAKITVYDILGKEVAVLVNEKLKAGEYEVKFEGNGLSSGIYYYKLETENFTDIKKMVLIK